MIVLSLAVALRLVAPSQVSPPCVAAEHHQFDFWIGHWVVTGPQGKVAGRNEIGAILGGCALRETWVGAGGMTGTSLNAFDPSDGRWHQTWVDDHGLVLRLSGGLQEGRMVLSGEAGEHGALGLRLLHRITWEKLDRDHVRQVWESSRDKGRNWSVVFDGRYERADAERQP